MYKNIFQVFTFYFYDITPMEKHLWNWMQITRVLSTEQCLFYYVHKFLYANLITFKEEFYILVTSLTRLRRETTCCICIRLKVISFEYFYDNFYTSNSKLYMVNMYLFFLEQCSNMFSVRICMSLFIHSCFRLLKQFVSNNFKSVVFCICTIFTGVRFFILHN